LFNWQQYEQYRTTTREAPKDYPYHASTSLFSAFRWISEELLHEVNVNAMSIFATTHYSCWETILNESLYSRDKTHIQAFTTLYRLTLEDVKDILHNFYGIEKDIISQVKTEDLELWTGRPGFLMDIAKVTLKMNSKDPLEGIQKALEIAMIYMQNLMISAKVDYSWLFYHLKMHNGVMTDKTKVDHLVKFGVAIKSSSKSGLLCEPMIKKLIYENETDFDPTMEKILVDKMGQNVGELGERAIALQVM
jgi:hypothetical protein